MSEMVEETQFKDSPVGRIPVGWDFAYVEQIGRVIRGASPRPKGDPRYYGGKVPRLMVADVTRDGKYVTPTTDFLTEEGAKLSRPLDAGSLTIVCSGVVGVPSILKVPACIHDGFLALVEISCKCSKEFLYYYFLPLQNLFDSSATHGGIFTNLTTQILKEFPIALPPLDEQKKIASILTSVDQVIEKTESEISKLQDLKKGMMQQLLTQGIGHTQFKDSPVGRIPVGWEVKKIGDVANIRTGNKDTKDRKSGGRYLFFVRSQTVERIDSYSFEGKGILTAGDGVGTGKVFHYIDGKFDFHQRVYLLSNFDHQIEPKFLYEFFRSNFIFQVNKFSAKGSVDSVRMEMISKMPTPVPPLEEQQKIASILTSIDDSIQQQQRELQQTQNLKKSLMQDLLTGKVRVKVD